MALINCRECNHEISSKAKSCPNCGYKINGILGNSIVKIALALTAIYLLSVIVDEYKRYRNKFAYQPTSTTSQNKVTASLTEKKTAQNLSHFLTTKEQTLLTWYWFIQKKETADGKATKISYYLFDEGLSNISADRLQKDYAANEVAADVKYKGKTINITGHIGSINSDINDKPFITFKVENPWQSPQAAFSLQNLDTIIALKKGDPINLACIGAGEIAGTPTLRACRFVKDLLEQRDVTLLNPLENFTETNEKIIDIQSQIISATIQLNETLKFLEEFEILAKKEIDQMYIDCQSAEKCGASVGHILSLIKTSPKSLSEEKKKNLKEKYRKENIEMGSLHVKRLHELTEKIKADNPLLAQKIQAQADLAQKAAVDAETKSADSDK